jgi:hypothetical protein
MREAKFLLLVRGSSTSRERTGPTPPPRLSISGDSIRGQVMQLVLMGHGTVAPQIEALEAESWGVTWGMGVSNAT